MSKTAKEIVKNFYRSDILRDNSVLEKFFHPEIVLILNSSDGLAIMHYDDMIAFFT